MNIIRALFVTLLWFIFWIGIGCASWGLKPGFAIGFIFAYLSGFALAWIIPEPIQKWMEAETSQIEISRKREMFDFAEWYRNNWEWKDSLLVILLALAILYSWLA